ncbi:hypothetical protein C6P40_004283 [Pichia californica]|uniref:Uncharacterized protein n=1 Tax=Pichia californica TaxID=460514 RepID=A0A9P6WQC6_9ASCO|nr:hypothetical protein C6P40_004283 [[Candida] californica]
MAATSATNRRYMESMTPNGLQSTHTLRQQPMQSQRTMSLSNRSLRNSEVPRTMSMRSSINQPGSRSMSMTAGTLRANRPGSVSSRTNSLTANSRTYQQQQHHHHQQQQRSNQRLNSVTNTGSRTGSRVGSRVGSRANSLTSNSSNSNSKIVKTTTLEKDATGRTKSITTKTIERRNGKVKITTTTVVQPQPIEEDDELDDLDELEHFDSHHGHNYDNTSDFDDPVDINQYDDQYVNDQGENYYMDEEEEDDDEYYYDKPRGNGAATAAAAALAGHTFEPRHSWQREQSHIVKHQSKQLGSQSQQSARFQKQQQKQQRQQKQQLQKPVKKMNAQYANQQSLGRQIKPEVKFQDSRYSDDYADDTYESYNDFYETEIPQQPTTIRNNNYSDNYEDYEQESYNEEKYQELKSQKKQKPGQRQSLPPTQREKVQSQQKTKFNQRPQSQQLASKQQTVNKVIRKTNQPSDNESQLAQQDNLLKLQKTPPQPQNSQLLRAHFQENSDEIVDDVPDDNGDDGDEEMEEMFVVSQDMDSFQAKAQKRLSGIQEVTEMTYDEDTDIVDGEDFMEDPILNSLGISKVTVEEDYRKKQFKGKATLPSMYEDVNDYFKPAFIDNITTTSSATSDENFVEAQEEIVNDPPAITNINNISSPSNQSYQFLKKNNAKPQSHTGGAHSYRNLLYNDNSRRSPIKNSIPQFDSKHNDYINEDDDLHYSTNNRDVNSVISSQPTSPVNYQTGNFNNFDQLEDNLGPSISNTATSNQRKLKLKSVLKNSSSSLSSPVSEANNVQVKQNNNMQKKSTFMKKSVSTPVVHAAPKKEITPDEMYAMALKAAEKKVYGSRLNEAYPDDDIDDDTKLNTMANIHANTPVNSPSSTPVPIVTSINENGDQKYNSGVSHPGLPYKSNAAGMGFRMHSLRNGGSSNSDRISNYATPQETSKFKKLFKHEQKAKKKEWESERKAATGSDSNLVKMAQEKVEREVNGMPISPQVELQRMQHEHDSQTEHNNLSVSQNGAANGQTIGIRHSIDQTNDAVKTYENNGLQNQVTATDSISDNVTSPVSPSKLNLKIFRLGKKKIGSPEQTHTKKASIVSQESVTPVVHSRNSIDGKKSKLFSFGFGNHDHPPVVEAPKIESDIQKKSQIAESSVPNVQEIIVPDELENVKPNLENTNAVISPTIPATETIFTNNPAPSSDIGGTNEDSADNNLANGAAANTGESFVKPNDFEYKPHDNFARGPNGSSVDILQTGTNQNIPNVNTSADTGNISANVTEPMSTVNKNIEYSQSGAGKIPQNTDSGTVINAAAELTQPQKISSNASSTTAKSGKKGGRRFMKFFNL